MSSSKGKAPDHRVGMTKEDFALFCWLRQHPDVAATYGIKSCNGMTLVGSMLRQTLEAQGMAVEWHLQLPNDATGDAATGNTAGAQFIKKIGARPGQRLKNLKERLKDLECANRDVPLTAAIKRRGGKPKVSFPLLLALARGKRARVFSSRGNRIGAPAAVALVERDVVTSFITKQLRCKCGAHLAFCRHASSQTGVCGAWQFVCERSCKLPLLETGTRLHGDDYLLNTKVSYACESCAIPFERLVSFLALLGVAPLSKTSHYTLKHEIEPVTRGLAEESMAEAHQRNVVAGTTDYVSVDGGYTSLRNAHGCTMGAHAPDRSIVAVEHKRLSDDLGCHSHRHRREHVRRARQANCACAEVEALRPRAADRRQEGRSGGAAAGGGDERDAGSGSGGGEPCSAVICGGGDGGRGCDGGGRRRRCECERERHRGIERCGGPGLCAARRVPAAGGAGDEAQARARGAKVDREAASAGAEGRCGGEGASAVGAQTVVLN